MWKFRICRITSTAVLAVMKFIYDNIMYAELNTKSDYCEMCGYDGEIKIVTDDYRQAGLGVPELRQPRPEQAVRCKTYLRLYRNPVLESGTYTGDQGQSPSPVELVSLKLILSDKNTDSTIVNEVTSKNN